MEPLQQDERSTPDLLRAYAAILVELRRRAVVRSNNPPAGDYGEWLAREALGGVLVANSVKSYDLMSPQHGRVQVKTRVVSTPMLHNQRQTSSVRSFDFDHAAFVLLRQEDYGVHRGVLVPVADVKAAATRDDHVNGWRLMMTSALLDHPAAEDITDALRQAASTA